MAPRVYAYSQGVRKVQDISDAAIRTLLLPGSLIGLNGFNIVDVHAPT
jgi:hypothetical protein